MTPPARYAGQKIICPDCFVKVPVPALATTSVKSKPKPKKKKSAKTEAAATESKALVEPKPEAEVPDYVKVICPTCRARLHPPVKDVSYTITCPDCFVKIEVPALDDIPKPQQKRVQEDVGQYGLEAPLHPVAVRTSITDAQAEIRKEAPPPLPRWTFFSGVFNFPWQTQTIFRWTYLSLDFIALGLLVAFMLSFASKQGGFPLIALAFFALPLIWLTVWSFSYAAASCLPVLIDTAAGNDRIETWPEPNWKEWALQLIYISYIGIVAEVLSYIVGQVCAILTGSPWIASVVALFILFPVVLLSALEANTLWVPFTAPILKSLKTLWWGWLLFYALTALMAGAWLALLLIGISIAPYLTMLVAGPTLSAVLLIGSRLLGRLAWRAANPAVYDKK